jgi:hypothetical protein
MIRAYLQLPDRDADLYSWARGAVTLFDRGPRAAFLHATSRQRYAGPGELSGVLDVGRLRDIRYARSVMREQEIYRYREISPERQALVLTDLRCVARNEESIRLLSCAVAATVLAAVMPETRVTWAAFGADRPVPSIALESARPAVFLRGAAKAMLQFGRDPYANSLRKQEGAIRRLMAGAPDAHLIIITHHMEPGLFRRIPFQFGATVLLVEAAADGLRNPRGGASLTGLLVPGLTGELNLPVSEGAASLQSRRAQSVLVRADGPLLEAITSGFAKAKHSPR